MLAPYKGVRGTRAVPLIDLQCVGCPGVPWSAGGTSHAIAIGRPAAPVRASFKLEFPFTDEVLKRPPSRLVTYSKKSLPLSDGAPSTVRNGLKLRLDVALRLAPRGVELEASHVLVNKLQDLSDGKLALSILEEAQTGS